MKSKISYLNFILTVIAVALTVIILQNASVIPAARAAYPVSLPLNEKGEMVVRVANSTMDVNIEEVGGYNTYGTIDVKIKD